MQDSCYILDPRLLPPTRKHGRKVCTAATGPELCGGAIGTEVRAHTVASHVYAAVPPGYTSGPMHRRT